MAVVRSRATFFLGVISASLVAPRLEASHFKMKARRTLFRQHSLLHDIHCASHGYEDADVAATRNRGRQVKHVFFGPPGQPAELSAATNRLP